MAEFYTKQQVDELATIIGTRIKNHSSAGQEPAKDISSFMAALDGLEAPTQFINIPITTPTFDNLPPLIFN